MKPAIRIFSLFCIFAMISTAVFAGKADPVAVLFQVSGAVEYTKNGKSWKKVRRNKFLFSGYQIRTGDGASGKITDQKTGEDFNVGPNTIVEVNDDGIKVVSGDLGSASKSNQLVAGLMQRFDKSQSYTTIRRSASRASIDLDAVRSITVSAAHPDMVWENEGSQYSYKLTVGEKEYRVGPTKEPMVRVKLEPFVGTQPYVIYLYEGDKEIAKLEPYKSRGKLYDRTIEWVSGEKESKINNTLHSIQQNFPDNSFMLGSFYENEEMWVAAMDQYKHYLGENPDEVEMTPYLFRIYKKLSLKEVYKKELEEYKTALRE